MTEENYNLTIIRSGSVMSTIQTEPRKSFSEQVNNAIIAIGEITNTYCEPSVKAEWAKFKQSFNIDRDYYFNTDNNLGCDNGTLIELQYEPEYTSSPLFSAIVITPDIIEEITVTKDE